MNRSLCLLALLAACNDRTLFSTSPALDSPCHFRAPREASRTVFAWVADGQVTLIAADGTRTVAHRFGGASPVDPALVVGQQLAVSGRYLAAATQWSLGAGTPGWHEELVLLDSDGRQHHRRSWDNQSLSQLQVNARGTITAATGGGDVLVIDADGATRTLAGAWPLHPARADGSVAVAVVGADGAEGAAGWSRPGSAELLPLAYPPSSAGARTAWLDDRLLYLASDGGATVLVSEAPGDARLVPLPTSETLSIGDATPDGWLLVGGFRDPRYRVNARTGEVTPLATRSDGLRPFQGDFQGPRLDSDGALLLGLRDEIAGGLYRSSDGASWTRLGASMAHVLDVVGAGRGGSYLIGGTNSRYAQETWQDPTAAEKPDLSGASLQLVRPAAQVARVLADADTWDEPHPELLTPDGLCFAYWTRGADGQDATLRALDVESGDTTELAQSRYARDSAAWITGD